MSATRSAATAMLFVYLYSVFSFICQLLLLYFMIIFVIHETVCETFLYLLVTYSCLIKVKVAIVSIIVPNTVL